MVLSENSDYVLDSHQQIKVIFVMVKCGVFCDVRAEFLNN
jgi:hypothetical protein